MLQLLVGQEPHDSTAYLYDMVSVSMSGRQFEALVTSPLLFLEVYYKLTAAQAKLRFGIRHHFPLCHHVFRSASHVLETMERLEEQIQGLDTTDIATLEGN